MSAITMTITQAIHRGRDAFERGTKAAPALDAQFILDVNEVVQAGSAVSFCRYLQAWSDGWHRANLDQDAGLGDPESEMAAERRNEEILCFPDTRCLADIEHEEEDAWF